MKNGYAVLELSQEEVSGVAIFQLPSGLEASVLPTNLSTGFALYVEMSASMDTGIAFCRETLNPVSLRLYNSEGQLVGTQMLQFSGKHDAQFLGEFFTLGSSFQGTLIAESLSEFAMVGLRYGGGVLSTIPVTDLAEPIPPAPPSPPTANLSALFSPKGGVRTRLIQEISKARSSLDLAIYSFTSDDLRQALVSAKSRGVQIRVVADAGQANGQGGEIPTLEANGFSVRRCNGGTSSGDMHNKYMIVDGKFLFTGSYNWSARAEDSSYENALFVSGSPVIASYMNDFTRLWGCQTSSSPSDPPPPPDPPGCDPNLITVWVNTDSGIYHCPGSQWYGNTNEGKYMSQGAAIAAGYRAAYYNPCEWGG